MKKIILSAIAVAALAISTEAQTSARFGVKGGLNLAHATANLPISTVNFQRNYFGPGFYAGGLMELSFPRGSKFKVQPEVLFNYNSLLSDNHNIRLGAVSIPVAFKYFVHPDFSLMAGPSFNFNVIGASVAKSINNNPNKFGDALNTFQLGLFAGANYYINKGFFVDARYTYNLGSAVDFSSYNESSLKYGQISLGVGYKF